MASAIDARGRLSPTLDAEGHAPAVAPPNAEMSRRPTLRFPGPSSALGAKGKWAPSDIVTRWTNTDVVMWALNKDLKVHIPALVQHGLTGSALQQLPPRKTNVRAMIGALAKQRSAGARLARDYMTSAGVRIVPTWPHRGSKLQQHAWLATHRTTHARIERAQLRIRRCLTTREAQC